MELTIEFGVTVYGSMIIFLSISNSSSTWSDVQTVPPELTQLFDDICKNSAECFNSEVWNYRQSRT